ncbi:hypothetical protein SAMN05216234_13717 [Hydrogenimonas thermophila]|uniref:Uncharacterized protein n=1 Tax=Hydrogenimonas thermophila TaxID=223786 RepID=A0A1I5SVI0_9BACT|nr:hypothetical protein SAMN05216234_13717 [Hydrogenimonas thermophila]
MTRVGHYFNGNKLSYRVWLFIFWNLYVLFIFLFFSNDIKGMYIFMVIGSLPISFISERIIQFLDLSIIFGFIIFYIFGAIQWGVFIGGLIDKFISNINKLSCYNFL